jgi:hypothetical protein
MKMHIRCAGVKMSLFNSIKKRMTNQFLSIIVYEDKCKIKQRVVKGDKLLHLEEFNLDIPSRDNLGGKVINFIKNLQDEYENTYISLFLNTLGQGLLPRCNSSEFAKFSVDVNSVKSICVDGKFMMYAAYIDINWAEKLFKKIGLDFIFSPFLILNHFIRQNSEEAQQSGNATLNILNSKNSLTLMVESEGRILYGSFLNTAKEDDLLTSEEYEEFDDEEIDLDELELDEEDLELDDIDEVSKNDFTVNLLDDAILDEDDKRSIKYIDRALKDFYSNDLYESRFIDRAVIYDDASISEGVLKHIESELLLDTTAKNINIADAMFELSKQEVGF